jgi:hypothetical protein
MAQNGKAACQIQTPVFGDLHLLTHLIVVVQAGHDTL